MHKRLFGLLATAALAFAACQGAAATPSPTVAPTAAPTAAPTTAPSSAAPTAAPTAAPSSAAPSASATAAASSTAPSASASTSTAPSASGSTAPSASGSVAPSSSAGGGADLVSTYTPPDGPATKTGGTLVMGEWQALSTLNCYYAAANADFEACSPAFASLINIDQNLKYIPELASNVPTVANGGVVVTGDKMDVTWDLKPGMKWSDGQPITCADVQGTWKWVMDPAQTGLYAGTVGYDQITGIDGGTGTTCVMHYKSHYSAYLLNFSFILPEHYISTVAVKDAPTKLYPLKDPKSGVYSGCYIPTQADPSSQVTYVANPNCSTIWGHAPYLDKIIFKYYGDAAAMVQGFRANEIDMAMDLSDSDIPTLTDVPQNQQLVQDALFNESNYFNNKRFKDKFGDTDGITIIKAIMKATDVDAVIKGPMNGTVTRANSFVSPLLWFYKQEPAWPAADPQGAAAMLDAAGWAVGSDGIRAKNGKKLEVEYCTTTRQYRADSITLIASQLKAIGILADVKVKPANPDVFGGWNNVPADQDCNTSHGNFDVDQGGHGHDPGHLRRPEPEHLRASVLQPPERVAGEPQPEELRWEPLYGDRQLEHLRLVAVAVGGDLA
jgi:peptide/nickel transport system substrate-binding protein